MSGDTNHILTAGDGVKALGPETHDNAVGAVLLWARRRGIDPGDVNQVCQLLDIDPDVAAARRLHAVTQAVLDATLARQQARRDARRPRRWT